MKSISLDSEELCRLRGYMRDMGLREVDMSSGYEAFRVDDKERDILLIAYKTGRLVYSDTDASRELIQRVMKTEMNFDFVLGTDEAGKGEWYGPLVVECVALTPGEIPVLRGLGVRDSKNIRRKTLLGLGRELTELGFVRRPLVLMPETYNRKYEVFRREGKRLNDLLAWAHSRVIKDVLSGLEFEKIKVFIDEFDARKTEFRLGDLVQGVEVIQKIGAESEIPVAAASVLAKFIYEKEVDGLNEKFGVDLRNSKPGDIPPEILPKVAKLHFRNVSSCRPG
jgi:ribonuclease HIII